MQDNYPQQYKNKPFPNTIADPWLMYCRQCTSYCAFRLSQTGFDIGAIRRSKAFQTWNANFWDDRARELGARVDHIPEVGAIAQWESTHVAIVEKVNNNGTILISEYNYTEPGKFGERTISASKPSNYIHFNDKAIASSAPIFLTETDIKSLRVTCNAPRGVKIRLQPTTTANIATNTGTKKDGVLSPGEWVENCTLIKGETVDGINGWWKSPRGRYFWSGCTDQPKNV